MKKPITSEWKFTINEAADFVSNTNIGNKTFYIDMQDDDACLTLYPSMASVKHPNGDFKRFVVITEDSPSRN